MFKKILIANRGEIACRVIKTARRMGIATVAVYSEADAGALHVELADEAVCIGPAASKQSYLVMDNITAACRETGAEAVHPGYGFLSENEAFARRLEESGIVFIGPKHAAIAAMGDKIASKKLAAEAGVNTIPGWNDAIDSPERAVEIARDIGYPVMIKASAGGGGKGLRVAHDDAEAAEGFASCRSEAANAFGDDRVFIEKFVVEPRHIEIQVLGDAHGNVVYLNERECSIQRRHQKVIEEAPSPFLDAATRRAMGEQAVALAQAVGYQSAGTVEFVVGADKSFYFLEMNTRRINAEDPFRGFLPSTGRLVKFRPPAEVPGAVRVDTGVYEGGEIPMFYDSMIAKLIVHGRDRKEAIARMRDALNAFVIRGISSNIPFQAALLQHPRFCSGQFNTGFIAEEYGSGFDAVKVPHDDPLLLAAVAMFAHWRRVGRDAAISGQMDGAVYMPPREWTVVVGEHEYAVSVEPVAGGLAVSHEGRALHIESDWGFNDLLFEARIDGVPVCLQVERRGLGWAVSHFGLRVDAQVLSARAAELLARMPKKLPPDLTALVLSPMPGLLRELAVAQGQEVKSGEKVAVIEAMKMENVLRAERDGRVKCIHAQVGASLAVDDLILEFD